jgi:hypothetical protein
MVIGLKESGLEERNKVKAHFSMQMPRNLEEHGIKAILMENVSSLPNQEKFWNNSAFKMDY